MSQQRSNKNKPMRHLFGTDGVRGVANQEPMTSEMALKLGRAIRPTPPAGSCRHRLRAKMAKMANTATRY
jgi:hypothetical protein